MKVFWSWQSDRPGKTGRHFVRDALDIAIKQLASELTVEDCDRPDELHVDQDRQGIPGSPDLVPTILKKIDSSKVFVADVTAVGKRENGLSIINSNVAIELGYAFKSLGSEHVLLVINTAFGEVERLPFDLRHKGGSLRYCLHPNADEQVAASQMKMLAGKFKSAIKEIIVFATKTSISHPIHTPSAPRIFTPEKPLHGKGLPIVPGSPIGQDEFTRNPIHIPDRPRAYLRLIPHEEVHLLKFTQARKRFEAGQLRPLQHESLLSGSFAQADNGIVEYWYSDNARNLAQAFTKLFLSGEIWTVSSVVVDKMSAIGEFIPAQIIEDLFSETLSRITSNHFSDNPNSKVKIIAGMEAIKSKKILYGGHPLTFTQENQTGGFEWSEDCDLPLTDKTSYEFLIPFFEVMWDNFYTNRPHRY